MRKITLTLKDAQNIDNTTASAKIPKAGITNLLIILVGIISLIRYKNIKLV